ncbi:MAG TPA: YihY/virulence factor BrkB family protein [Terracidiphilus sp.]|nr:YihY/virulence factor BrkB family protein [Terracidiphilus sp.]
MEDVSNSGTKSEEIKVATAEPDEVPVTETKWFRLRSSAASLVRYLLDSEVHTYAFSVAANAILSFIPLIVLLYALADAVPGSKATVKVVTDTVTDMVKYFVPSDPDFVATVSQKAASHQELAIFPIIMILVACTGIFLPLEVALNQAWGVTKSRNYIMNQLVAFGLAILLVALGIASVSVNAVFNTMLTGIFFGHTDNFVFKTLTFSVLAATTGVAAILFFFSIYWLLPNRKVPWRPVVRTSIVTGIIWLLSKYAFLAVLPHFHLKELYGGFHVSVGIIFWAYTSGLILFAGAQFSVRNGIDKGE